jgi:hypothetical protein
MVMCNKGFMVRFLRLHLDFLVSKVGAEVDVGLLRRQALVDLAATVFGAAVAEVEELLLEEHPHIAELAVTHLIMAHFPPEVVVVVMAPI